VSADNWTQCPRCYVTNKAKADELDREASESYGKVSAEKFDELRSLAFSFRKDFTYNGDFTDTLREDYSTGIRKGEFHVSYGALCQTCGFKFEFKHEEKVQ
jgi:predicted Zn-ribbon and HTH transcriptional regulator